MTEFEGVVPALGQALSKRGYDVLTPVQVAVLSPELKEADLLVSAQTGSGKTVAFGLTLGPTLLDGADRFARAKAPLALAVAPTRELAMQLKRELEWLYEPTGAIIASCVGGMDMRAERQALGRGAHIVVGTPGRLRDHIERGSFDTTGLRAVVLDEADEMLDLGFREDLEYILDAAPKDRRTLMFSATVPRAIASLAKRYQRNAVRIATSAEQKQHLDIEYRALTVAPNDRENAIINLLRYVDPKSALVFCGTRAMVNHMTSRFTNRGFSVVALSGELSQNERSHALQAMRDGRARVCIATDVAARGIDLPNLDLVIHADIPKNREILLHRSGRTGRAGRKGVCVLIVPHTLRRRTEQLLRSANVEAKWAKPPSLQDIMRVDRERILDDPTLSEPLSEDEKTFAGELLARHGAEHVAASFLRMHQARLPGPEELLDAAPPEDRKPKHDGFKGGVWFSLSVGRKHSAEARWLLPMLCRAGHITKREIGAIKILPNETHVELASDCVERFLEAVGPSRKVEKTITITRLEGAPSVGRGADKPHGAKRPYSPAKPGHKRKPFQGPEAPREPRTLMEKAKPWEKATNKRKSFQGPGTPTGEVKPWEKTLKRRKPQGAGQEAGQKLGVPAVPGTPMGEAKPWEKTPKKRKPKKPRKPKSNKAATK
jgi:ATP-dependent RNA helicase DeaD